MAPSRLAHDDPLLQEPLPTYRADVKGLAVQGVGQPVVPVVPN